MAGILFRFWIARAPILLLDCPSSYFSLTVTPEILYVRVRVIVAVVAVVVVNVVW